METVLQDIRVTLRAFRRSPAIPPRGHRTLALGIGATTAIFSTLNAVLLKPLPYPEPAGSLQHSNDARRRPRDDRAALGRRDLRLNDPNLSIARAAAFQPADLTLLNADGTPQHVKVYGVTEGFFELFGLPMTKGGFAHDDFTPHSSRRRLTRRPRRDRRRPSSSRITSGRRCTTATRRSIGKPIRFAEIPVATRLRASRRGDFDTPHGADFWFAQRDTAHDVNHGQEGFMRLKPGASIERARSEMAAVMAGLARDFPGGGPQSRLRHQAARRVDRRRPGPDPDHRHVGDGTVAAARVRERRRTCCSRAARRARARWRCVRRSAPGAAVSFVKC